MPKRNVIFTRKHMTKGAKMDFSFREPYGSLFNEYREYEKTRLSRQGFISNAGRTKRLVGWLEERNLLPEDVGIAQAMEFVNDMGKRLNRDGSPISQGAICNYIKVGRRFCKYLLEKEILKANPFLEVEYPRIPDHLSRNVLTESQMNCLLERLKRFDECGTRKMQARLYVCHVLAELMYSTGLRIDEVSGLKAGDIDLESRIVHVKNGKGGKSRAAFLTTYAAEVLKIYIERGKDFYDGTIYGEKREHLFSTKGNILMQMLNGHLRKTCAELEIPIITSHGFRHSLGTHLLRAGCDMRHIQVILGHDKLSSTQVYTKVYSEDLKNSIDSYHPRRLIKKEDGKNGK